jgi:hypothetical protein
MASGTSRRNPIVPRLGEIAVSSSWRRRRLPSSCAGGSVPSAADRCPPRGVELHLEIRPLRRGDRDRAAAEARAEFVDGPAVPVDAAALLGEGPVVLIEEAGLEQVVDAAVARRDGDFEVVTQLLCGPRVVRRAENDRAVLGADRLEGIDRDHIWQDSGPGAK